MRPEAVVEHLIQLSHIESLTADLAERDVSGSRFLRMRREVVKATGRVAVRVGWRFLGRDLFTSHSPHNPWIALRFPGQRASSCSRNGDFHPKQLFEHWGIERTILHREDSAAPSGQAHADSRHSAAPLGACDPCSPALAAKGQGASTKQEVRSNGPHSSAVNTLSCCDYLHGGCLQLHPRLIVRDRFPSLLSLIQHLGPHTSKCHA